MNIEDAYKIKNIMALDELRFLMDSISGVDKTQAIVNIGTYYGASAAALLLGMHKYDVTGPLACIGTFRYHHAGSPRMKPFRERSDIRWDSKSFLAETMKNLDPFTGNKSVYYSECFSDDFDLSFIGDISLVFIDADHSEHGCLLDTLKYSQKVVDGGLMLFHDYTNFGSVRRAITTFTEIRSDFKLEKIHGSIAVVRKETTW